MRLLILSLLVAIPPALIPPAFAQPDAEALARRLLNSQGCKACHRIEGSGSTAAVDLDKIGSRLTGEQLRNKLVNPQQQHAAGRIADFSHLQDNEIDALITFLEQRQ